MYVTVWRLVNTCFRFIFYTNILFSRHSCCIFTVKVSVVWELQMRADFVYMKKKQREKELESQR